MHHQAGLISSGSWFWPALLILLVIAIVGFVIYWVSKKVKTSTTSTEEDEEEELGWENCPNLMVEFYTLRKEINDLKGAQGTGQS